MKQTLLFLSLVGAAIYGLLIISGGNTNENQIIQTQNHPVGERLSSWGSHLAPSQNPQLATSQRPAQTPPLAATENTTPPVGAKPDPVEWAKIVLAAQMHSQTSVSSQTVEDVSSIGSSTPTQVATESTTGPQAAKSAPPKANKLHYQSAVSTESTTEPQAAKSAPPKANKLHHQSTKPTVRGRVMVANADRPFGNWAQGR